MKTTLCTHCRSEFTDAEIKGAIGCPSCGTKGVPADLRKKHTITLTDHEWRIIFMWADNYARTFTDDGQGQCCIAGITGAVMKQAPDMPPLSLFAEIQDCSNAMGSSMTMVTGDGEKTEIEPEKKH